MKKAPQNTINILGQEYTLHAETPADNPKMEGNSGLCEPYSKRLILDPSTEGVMTVENFDALCHRVLRHEAFHAIFFEAGLTDYYSDETLIEALAQLYPKISKIMKQIDALDIDTLQ